MADKRNISIRPPRSVQWLRQAARTAEDWPVAGTAVRRFQAAESWALGELKQRLEDLPEPGPPRVADTRAPDPARSGPRDTMAALLAQSREIDPDAALDRLYRQTLSALVPDQVAMIALLAEKRIAPLCHVAAGRLPAGPVSAVVLANMSPLGRDAGVLLREYVPQYVNGLLALGVFEAGPEDARLDSEYELLMADTQLRATIQRIRSEMKMYPRLQRFSVHMSAYGDALWRDCRPAPAQRGRGDDD